MHKITLNENNAKITKIRNPNKIKKELTILTKVCEPSDKFALSDKNIYWTISHDTELIGYIVTTDLAQYKNDNISHNWEE